MDSFSIIFTIFTVMGAVAFPAQLIITAPYGKFTRAGWGKVVNGRISWMIQESPCIFISVYYLARPMNTKEFLLILIFSLKYFHRALIYGYLMNRDSKTTISMVISGVFFNIVNAYLQCAGIAGLDKITSNSARLWSGLAVWAAGNWVNISSDATLRKLRKSGKYQVPYGGLFEYVSAANYFGESVMWLGWAVACGNYCGWMFLLWTLANLVPRAISQHKWYLETFKEYKGLRRKAFFPFVF